MTDPDSLYTAYCAPGCTEAAEAALERDGTTYRQLTESHALEGREDTVLLVADPGLKIIDPVQLAGPPSIGSRFWRYWWYGLNATDPNDTYLPGVT